MYDSMKPTTRAGLLSCQKRPATSAIKSSWSNLLLTAFKMLWLSCTVWPPMPQTIECQCCLMHLQSHCYWLFLCIRPGTSFCAALCANALHLSPNSWWPGVLGWNTWPKMMNHYERADMNTQFRGLLLMLWVRPVTSNRHVVANKSPKTSTLLRIVKGAARLEVEPNSQQGRTWVHTFVAHWPHAVVQQQSTASVERDTCRFPPK